MSLTKSDIAYLTHNWPWVQGCNGPVGADGQQHRCAFCYLERLADRYGREMAPRFVEAHLNDPLRRREPGILGCVFGGDYLDPAILNGQIGAAVDVMRQADWHTYIALTKQAARLRSLKIRWPRNVWVGVTVNGPGDLHRATDLQHVDCARRWVSVEPLREALYLPPAGGAHDLPEFDAVVVGGMSGVGWEPLDLNAVRLLRDQCADRGIHFTLKQGAGLHPEHRPLLDGAEHWPPPWMRP